MKNIDASAVVDLPVGTADFGSIGDATATTTTIALPSIAAAGTQTTIGTGLSYRRGRAVC